MEVWKTIPNTNGLYQISNIGRVKRIAHTINRSNGTTQKFCEKYFTGYHEPGRYVRFTIKCKMLYQHRLIAEAFLPNPLKLEYINHKNGNKHDNRLENLEWCTPSENALHSRRVLCNKVNPLRGSSHSLSKSIIAINSVGEEKEFGSISDFARAIGARTQNVSRVLNGRRKTVSGYFIKLKTA